MNFSIPATYPWIKKTFRLPRIHRLLLVHLQTGDHILCPLIPTATAAWTGTCTGWRLLEGEQLQTEQECTKCLRYPLGKRTDVTPRSKVEVLAGSGRICIAKVTFGQRTRNSGSQGEPSIHSGHELYQSVLISTSKSTLLVQAVNMGVPPVPIPREVYNRMGQIFVFVIY